MKIKNNIHFLCKFEQVSLGLVCIIFPDRGDNPLSEWIDMQKKAKNNI